ncbi:hypothetical protein M426DRAFT_265362 [Hypoxylon sp. CI-4A]|nr:hypothetical protein M426DRAFT_265362 [Hypoxylon sp. CI-4A]
MVATVVEAASLAGRLESLIDDFRRGSVSMKADDRRRLSETARKLSFALETPGDTIHRVTMAAFQLPLVCVGVERKLFDVLAGVEDTATNQELAEKTGVDPVLLKRILRYYQAFDIVSQPGDDAYTANNITRAFTTPGGHVAPPFYLETIIPSAIALPQFLRENGYVNIDNTNHSSWQLGHQTDKSFFPWLEANPKQMELFLQWMKLQRDDLPTFLDVFDVRQELARGSTDSTPLFVDIGGALGHQCIAFKKKYPDIPGRIILQDQQGVIQRVRENPLPGFEGIETQVYDFFTPQPLKGARAYYISHVLHDWPDHTCVEILKNLKAGMTEESKLLIDEMVLPERGAQWRSVQYDIIMGTSLAAMERSYNDWAAIIDRAGLKIQMVWKHTKELDEAVIVAILK